MLTRTMDDLDPPGICPGHSHTPATACTPVDGLGTVPRSRPRRRPPTRVSAGRRPNDRQWRVMDSNQRRTTPTVLQSDPREALTSTNAGIVVAVPGIPRRNMDTSSDGRARPGTAGPPEPAVSSARITPGRPHPSTVDLLGLRSVPAWVRPVARLVQQCSEGGVGRVAGQQAGGPVLRVVDRCQAGVGTGSPLPCRATGWRRGRPTTTWM